MPDGAIVTGGIGYRLGCHSCRKHGDHHDKKHREFLHKIDTKVADFILPPVAKIFVHLAGGHDRVNAGICPQESMFSLWTSTKVTGIG